jgi:hypothetical protein
MKLEAHESPGRSLRTTPCIDGSTVVSSTRPMPGRSDPNPRGGVVERRSLTRGQGSRLPPENTLRVAILKLTMTLLFHRFYDIHPFSHLHLGPEIPLRTGPGKPCRPSSTRCPETNHEKVPLDGSGPSPLGFPVATLGQLARVVDISPTRNRHPVAQKRVPVVLEMEEPTKMAVKTDGSQGRL